MKRTTASPAVALAARLNPEPRRAVPVFLNDGRPIVSADTAADSPELNPAAPLGAVWDALFAAAYPAAVEG